MTAGAGGKVVFAGKKDLKTRGASASAPAGLNLAKAKPKAQRRAPKRAVPAGAKSKSPPAKAAVKNKAKGAPQKQPAKAGRPVTTPPFLKPASLEEITVVAPAENDPDRERVLALQEALAGLMQGRTLARVKVGMRVMEASTGRTLFQQDGAAMMDPASNQKILVATAALMRLGGDYRYRTEMVGAPPDANGVIPGNVALRGSGDPTFRTSTLEALANRLVSLGVSRIDGAVVVDPRRIGANENDPEDRPPVRVDWSAIVVRVRPGNERSAPVVQVKPELESIVIRNRAVTRGRRRGRIKLEIKTEGGKMIVDVSGRISRRQPGLLLRRVAPDLSLYSAALFRKALLDAGIEVKGPAEVAPTSGDGYGYMLAVHHSPPLTSVLRRVNKDSNNEWAERVLDTLGAEILGGAANTAKGLEVLTAAMDELGLSRTSYYPANGSGLDHENRISADAISDLLYRLYGDPRWGPEILQSFSVGGVDGTTRNRFRGSPAAHRVRSKTGTLLGKSALSGYVGDGQEVLIFAIMVEGIRSRRQNLTAVRNAQVSAVNAMMRYAQGVLEAPPSEQVPPGIDYELGEELLELEDEEPMENEEQQDEQAPTAPPPITPPPLGAPMTSTRPLTN